MKGFDFLHIKPAASGLNKFDLSFDHLTTADFGQIIPLCVIDCVPRDEIPVKARYFARLSPLAKPTYGRMYFKTASFFVPEFMLADEAEAFHAGSQSYEGVSTKLRYITYYQFVTALVSSTLGSHVTSGGDFQYVNNSGSVRYFKFNNVGRYYVKVLNALGYSLPTNVDFQTNSVWYTKFASRQLNLMPFLAFCKAYNDYMSRSTNYNTSGLTQLLRIIKHGSSGSSYFTPSTGQLSGAGLIYMLQQIRLCFENDYFTSAWMNPNAPMSAQTSQSAGSVPGNNPDSVNAGLDDTYLQIPTPTSPGGISSEIRQRSLEFLRRFDDFVRRYNYSGSRTYQKILAQFGIKTSDFRSNYAELLGTTSQPVQVGDVTATASTYNSTYGDTYVGDYAGKGIMGHNNDVYHKCHDYGYFLTVGYLTVAPMMAYGFDKMVLRTDKYDFYTPEFDGLGAEAISFGEVFATPLPDSGDTYLDDAVYGFTERYNSYRFKRDMITGDFRKFNNNDPENTWHMGRLLTSVRAAGAMVAQSDSMVYLPQADSEFDRVFSVTSGVDNFFITAQFDIQAKRPMKSLNEVPRLGVGDTVVPKNGNAVN